MSHYGASRNNVTLILGRPKARHSTNPDFSSHLGKISVGANSTWSTQRNIMGTINPKQLVLGLSSSDFKPIEGTLLQLDRGLTLRTYLDGYTLSPADKEVWCAIRANNVAIAILRRGSMPHALRWFNYLESVHPEIQTEFRAVQARAKDERAAASKAGGNYNIGLKDTEHGVVTRFPPEPS